MAPALLRAATLALRASSAVCPTTPTCPQDNQCSYTSNGVSLQVSCSTDFYGGDLQLAQTATLGGCMKICATTSNCAAVSYVGQNCYLKSTLNAAQLNDNVIGASVITRQTIAPATAGSPTTCPTSYSCPENDGCTYKGADQRTFALKCSADYYGGDFANMYAESLQSCNKACADNAQCVAASFVGGNGAGHCYLKDKNNGAGANDNVDGFAIDTRVPASSTISSSSSSTAASTTSSIISSASSTASSFSLSVTSTASSSSSLLSLSSSLASTPTPTPTPSTSNTPTTTPSTSSTPTPTPSTSSTPSPTPTPTRTGPQILINPSFEDGSGSVASPWAPNPTRNSLSTAGRVSSDAHTGTYSYQASPAGSGMFTHWLQQTITAVVGQSYEVSLWAKVSAGMNNCYAIPLVNNAYPASQVLTLGTAYKQTTLRFPGTFFAKASNTFTVYVRCDGVTAGGKVWVDDVTMTQVLQ